MKNKFMKWVAALGLLGAATGAFAGNRTWEAGEWIYDQISTPSNPASGKNKLYTKSGGGVYVLTSGGTETQLVLAGSSPSFVNTTLSGYLATNRRDESSSATLNAMSSASSFVKLTSTVTTINGIAAGIDGQLIVIYNATGSSVTINNQSGSASSANQINTTDGSAITLATKTPQAFMYDAGQSKWVVWGGGGSGGSGSAITSLTTDVVASGPGAAAATIQSNVVSNSKLAQVGAHTYKGNNTGSTANAADVAAASVLADISPLTTKGDTAIFGSSNTRFPVGANGTHPVADSTATLGVRYGLPTGFVNALVNADFEATTFSTGWTTTTGTAAVETSIVSQGGQSFKTTASSQTSKLDQDVTPTFQTNGVNIESGCWVNTTLTNVQVCSRANGSNLSCVAVSPSGNYAYYPVNFPGPSNGTSVGVEVSMTGSGTGSYYADNCYVGPARNLGSGFLASDWTNNLAFTFSGSGTVSNNNVWTRRVGDSMEVRGSVTQGTATSSTFSINLPSGYVIDPSKFSSSSNIQGIGHSIWSLSGSNPVFSSGVGAEIFYDGSTTSGVFLGTLSAGTLIKVAGNNGNASGDNIEFQFTVPILGWTSSQAAYRADITPANWSGYQTVSGGCSTTSTTYSDPSSCTGIALIPLVNRNFGTVTTASSSIPGITFTPPRLGNYLVCATAQLSTTLLATDSVRLTDGTNILNQGKSVTISAAGDASITVCGTEPVTTAGAVTVKLQLAASTSTAAIVNGTAANSSAIDWDLTEKDAPMPAPYLVGAVTSTTTGQEHIERATISGAGACAITSQSGSWISSTSHPGTGRCVLSFAAGEFLAAPSCVATLSNSGASAWWCNNSIEPTTSSAEFYCTTSTPAAADKPFNVMCMGPR